MKATDRRAFLETIAATAESDQVRLRALELLDRLDDRERAVTPPEPPNVVESYTDDPARLARLIELADEHLFAELSGYRERVERRARELVEEQAAALRSQFALVDAEAVEDAPQEPRATEEPPAPPETSSEPENARETHPIDEVAFRLLADEEPPSSLLRRSRAQPRRNQY